MTTQGFKPINELVNEVIRKHLPQGDISALSKQFDRICVSWPRCTTELISQNAQPVLLDEDTLVVETHSPVWANKLRYSHRSILKRLHDFGFQEITYLKVKVNPKRQTPTQ